MPKPKDIREAILKERGLHTHKTKSKHRRLVDTYPIPDGITKTMGMRYLEEKFKKPIQELVSTGSLSVVAKKLGTDPSTISRWKKRLGVTYSTDRLPVCKGCPKHGPFCQVGICNVLVDLKLWDLIPLKRTELL